MRKYLAFGEVIKTDIIFDGVLPKSTLQTTISIVEKSFPETANELTKVHRAGVQATFFQHTTFDILIWEGIVKYKISDSEIAYQLLGANDATLKIFTLSEALGMILLRRGYFLLHGSSVLINNAVHVFIGEPGAGKSTTAAAFQQAGCTILSDDLTAIKFMDNLPVVQAGTPALKVWQNALDGLGIATSNLEKSAEGSTKYLVPQVISNFPETHFPLHSITYLLEPASTHHESAILAVNAPLELLKHFPLPDQLLHGKIVKRHFEQSILLAETVPLNYLSRPINFAQLKEFVSKRIGR